MNLDEQIAWLEELWIREIRLYGTNEPESHEDLAALLTIENTLRRVRDGDDAAK